MSNYTQNTSPEPSEQTFKDIKSRGRSYVDVTEHALQQGFNRPMWFTETVFNEYAVWDEEDSDRTGLFESTARRIHRILTGFGLEVINPDTPPYFPFTVETVPRNSEFRDPQPVQLYALAADFDQDEAEWKVLVFTDDEFAELVRKSDQHENSESPVTK